MYLQNNTSSSLGVKYNVFYLSSYWSVKFLMANILLFLMASILRQERLKYNDNDVNCIITDITVLKNVQLPFLMCENKDFIYLYNIFTLDVLLVKKKQYDN